MAVLHKTPYLQNENKFELLGVNVSNITNTMNVFNHQFQVTFQSAVLYLVVNIPNNITKFGILCRNLHS